ncbi:MAG: hypothetical protein CMJ58_22725 [Planctomycetaceae bacterium]|nr:hypothetical protein [Planctomycetaceae bacterium]
MSKPNKSPQGSSAEHDPLEAVELLVWTMLDGDISDGQFAELEKLLSESESARERYVNCVQLHMDLTDHFNPTPTADAVAKAGIPVLGNLQTDSATPFPGPLPTPGQ